ncbi:MAG: SDR family NAD(P)-dependent oxidoreductase [Chloroflexi bacterium]|nr:SDR family NAD(P)-dependent oxidoreductase [Chloroflexota bacterium]
MRLVGKKVLVTGGAGFIASHLVDTLVRNNQVTVVDNLTSGKIENIQAHLEKGTINFVQSDITDLEQMKRLVRDQQIVFHLAVQGLRLSLLDPYTVHEVNATGTLNMCQAALEAGIERFVCISSSEAYGTAKTVPMGEDHPLVPTTPYGASKLAAEAYARSYYLAFGLPVVVVRPFNTYGPREHLEGVYGEVIPRFVLRVMNGISPIIFGDGLQTRDFTEVRDIVRGMVLACESEAMIGETVNIAAGREVSINDVARIILEVLGRDGDLTPVHVEARPGDVRRHYADISKAGQLLNFQPQISIEEGIRHYIEWVKGQGWDLKRLRQEEVVYNWRPQGND